MTTQQIIERSGLPARLVRSVIRATGKENLHDIAKHGIDGGFAGFIYTRETVAFFKRHKKEIVALVESMADELGEEPLVMVASFRCLSPADRQTKASIARCLYGSVTKDDDNVANALAWFAAEEVARAFEND